MERFLLESRPSALRHALGTTRNQEVRGSIKSRRIQMKVILKVFEYKETLEQDFSSLEEANELVNLISQNYPNLRFEPYIEVDENVVLSAS
jgi:hypothetical protein